MSSSLALQTIEVERVGDELKWPEDLSSDAYTLIYSHSKLELNQSQTSLKASKLYEAWAFDGVKSWHIWNRDGTWVCTTYDSRKIDKALVVEREQLLMKQFSKSTGKDTLVIHHRLAFDQDDQAYIAYSCPINLRKKGEVK